MHVQSNTVQMNSDKSVLLQQNCQTRQPSVITTSLQTSALNKNLTKTEKSPLWRLPGEIDVSRPSGGGDARRARRVSDEPGGSLFQHGRKVCVTPPTRLLRDEKWLKPNTPPPLSCAPAPSFARGPTVAMTLDN